MGWGHMGGYGPGWGMWVVMILGTLAFWLLVAYLVRLVVQGRKVEREEPVDRARPTSVELLDDRLARGEITPEEYEQTRRLLARDHRPA